MKEKKEDGTEAGREGGQGERAKERGGDGSRKGKRGERDSEGDLAQPERCMLDPVPSHIRRAVFSKGDRQKTLMATRFHPRVGSAFVQILHFLRYMFYLSWSFETNIHTTIR